MSKHSSKSRIISPVAIGGVGGSGTRLIAQIVENLGYYMGGDLNHAHDNLWFTLLFKRIEALSLGDAEFNMLLSIFKDRMVGKPVFSPSQAQFINDLAIDRPQHSSEWLQQRAASFLDASKPLNKHKAWGWKEPNTHVLIDCFQQAMPDLKYIHVVRNGLDMAFSDNQNQLAMWGPSFIGNHCRMTPYFSLKFWCVVHQRILKMGQLMGAEFLLINYDDFCTHPDKSLKRLFHFLKVNPIKPKVRNITSLIRAPSSIGRFRQYGKEMFDPEDIMFVKKMGFDTGD